MANMSSTQAHHIDSFMDNESQQQSVDPSTNSSFISDSTIETRQIASTSTSSGNEVSPTRNLMITPSRTSNLVADGSPSPIRVPGTYPPEWLSDHETDSCMACEGLFTLIKRRHHCRSCGKIFCSDCCRLKSRLLYMENKEARVCNNCYNLIEYALTNSGANTVQTIKQPTQLSQTPVTIEASTSSSTAEAQRQEVANSSSGRSGTSSVLKVQGVLKNSNQATRLSGTLNDTCNISDSSSTEQHSNKHVIFADGIRPGTDLTEPFLSPASPSSSSVDNSANSSFALMSRQNRTNLDSMNTSATIDPSLPQTSPVEVQKRVRGSRSTKNLTVCDELGYLPPIVISKDSPISNNQQTDDAGTSSNSLTNLIINQFKTSKKTIQASKESRNFPLNGVVKFEEISGLLGVNNVITFLLLKSFYLKVKIIKKDCCIDKDRVTTKSSVTIESSELNLASEIDIDTRQKASHVEDIPEYWCFTSSGLDKFGQNEVIFVIDRDKDNPCIPRDIFKIYLTLHELALRRQVIENLGNLLFQDGLLGSRDTAGLLFVEPTKDHCLKNLVLPDKKFFIALVLQRWEVPWSKIFPIRLLMRLGHKYGVYPFPIVSYRIRDPVYYEIGHTIVSILGDFRNFRYALTHVDGLRVMLDKTSKKVIVKLYQSNYMQFSKVLDSSNNEHVLAWSASPFNESDGHLVSVQSDEGQYETVEFYKKSTSENISFKNLKSGSILGASFIVFSGALKLNQSGQPAKISIVEDGLLIQIQSCTMVALKNAIHYMHNFEIDCENVQDSLNRVEIIWESKDSETNG